MITPTTHERSEWRRLAQDHYSRGLVGIGHRFMAAADWKAPLDVKTFDALQAAYRAWLIGGRVPA